MTPGFIQSIRSTRSTRSGGLGMNRDFGRSVGRDFGHSVNRDFAGQRSRFSITTDDSGKPSVRLDEGETGKIVVNTDGSFSVVVTPKPAASAAATPPATAPAEPVETASRRAFARFGRAFAGRSNAAAPDGLSSERSQRSKICSKRI